MRNFRFGLFLLIGFLVVTAPVYAVGIVPCGGTDQPECRACDLVQLGSKLIGWFIAISASTIALTFAWGGMKMVMSGGDMGAVSSARAIMTNSIIGLIIILGSWLIVDTMLKLFLNDQSYGVWNEVQCTVLPPTTTTPGTPPVVGGPSGKGPVAGGLSHADARTQLGGINVVSSGNCTDRTRDNCTSLDGIQPAALTEIKSVITSCSNCNLEITAGTETGHKNSCHVNGTCVDIRCANGCSQDQIVQINSSANANGARVVYETLDCGARDVARAKGVSAYCKSDSGYGHITGNHFSLYTQ